jgi:transcriptional regulator with XRE-family HTH domain
MPHCPVPTPKAIQQFRKQKGLSQQHLASILGVGVATVSRWETGQAKVTGTAAVVLRTVIAASHTGLTAELSRGSGYAIYQLLKDVFASLDQAPAPNPTHLA